MTSPFADASHSWDFLPGFGVLCRSNCQQVQRLLLFKQIVDGLCLLIHCCSEFCSAVHPDWFS